MKCEQSNSLIHHELPISFRRWDQVKKLRHSSGAKGSDLMKLVMSMECKCNPRPLSQESKIKILLCNIYPLIKSCFINFFKLLVKKLTLFGDIALLTLTTVEIAKRGAP